MNRIPVTSSHLASVAYDQATNTLEVEFEQGGVYQYYGVPAAVHAALMVASSVGTYFAANVKKAGYSYKRVG